MRTTTDSAATTDGHSGKISLPNGKFHCSSGRQTSLLAALVGLGALSEAAKGRLRGLFGALGCSLRPWRLLGSEGQVLWQVRFFGLAWAAVESLAVASPTLLYRQHRR